MRRVCKHAIHATDWRKIAHHKPPLAVAFSLPNHASARLIVQSTARTRIALLGTVPELLSHRISPQMRRKSPTPRRIDHWVSSRPGCSARNNHSRGAPISHSAGSIKGPKLPTQRPMITNQTLAILSRRHPSKPKEYQSAAALLSVAAPTDYIPTQGLTPWPPQKRHHITMTTTFGQTYRRALSKRPL